MKRNVKRIVVVTALLTLALTLVSVSVVFSQEEEDAYKMYMRPGIRFGSNSRVIGYYDFMVPLYTSDTNVLFFNPKLSHDDRSGYEWNLGLGYRHMLMDEKLILGANAYWDWRNSSTGNKFQQIGLGLEVFTEWVNARANGYISISDAHSVDMWKEWYFGPTSLEYSWAYTLEVPMSGLDYEVGFKVPYVSDYVETWVYGGGYHYWGDYVSDVHGFVGRVEVIPTDFLRVNYEYRNDNVHGTEHYGEIMVEIPFSIENLIAGKNPFEGMGSHIGGSRTMEERMFDPVRRDVDIITDEEIISRWTHPGEVLPGDPAEFFTGVYFATPGGAGAGTLYDPGSPADGLASSAPTVFLLPGNYTGMTWNRDNSNFLGVGFDPTLHDAVHNQTNLSGNSNMSGGLVVDASGVLVKGFNIDTTGSMPIDVRWNNGDVTITNNILTTTISRTINVRTGCYGIYIGDNTIANRYAGVGSSIYAEDVDDLYIIGNTMTGLSTTRTMYIAGGDNIHIGSNTIGSLSSPVALPISIWEYGGVMTTNVYYTGNTSYSIDRGFHVNNSSDAGGISNYTITSNTFSVMGGTDSQGIRFWSQGGNYPLTDVTISGNNFRIISLGDAWAVMLYNSILTNVSVTGNSGSVVGASGFGSDVYFIRLDADGGHLNWGGIGTGLGQNNMTNAAYWNGNYPSPGGPIMRINYLGTLSP